MFLEIVRSKCGHGFQDFRDVGVGCFVYVGVDFQRDFRVLVAEALGDGRDRDVVVDQETRVGVAEVVQADPFHSSDRGVLCQTGQKHLLGRGHEGALGRLVIFGDEAADRVHDFLRHGDCPGAGFRLGRADIFQLPVICFVDMDLVCIIVEILRRQGEEFADAHPGEEEDGEKELVVLVVDGGKETLEFVLLPELDMGARLADAARDDARIGREAVEPHGEIQKRRKADADIPMRMRGKRLAGEHGFQGKDGVLPFPDRGDGDLVDRQVAEIRKNVPLDHAGLAVDRRRLPARLQVGKVNVAKAFQRHFRGPSGGALEFILEFLGVALFGKAAPRRLDALALPVGVIEARVPCAAGFVFVNRHRKSSIDKTAKEDI